jgi:hypothetical protein
MVTLPGRKVAEIQVVNSVGDDEFTELSFVSIASGGLGKALDSYYVSDE